MTEPPKMPPSAFLLLRSPHGRCHGLRLSIAVIVVALGSGAVAEVWARMLGAYGYALPESLALAFARHDARSWRALAVVALIGPLVEETLFRGGLQRVLLWFYRPALAVTVGALTFAAAHLNWMQFGPALWMGFMTGTIFARTGSLSLCFLWHAAYNAQFMLPYIGVTAAGELRRVPQAGALGARGLLLAFGLVLLWWSLRALPEELRPQWVIARQSMSGAEPARARLES